MDTLQAILQLRPGTAWACDVINGQEVNIRQIENGTSLVSIPTDDEIKAVKAAYVPPLSLVDQVVALQAQVAALLAASGK